MPAGSYTARRLYLAGTTPPAAPTSPAQEGTAAVASRPATPGTSAPRGWLHEPVTALFVLAGAALVLVWIARHGLRFGGSVKAAVG